MQNTSITNIKLNKDTIKQICEALGCSQNASTEITVDAGRFGSISLLLCVNCVGKFVDVKKSRGPRYVNR